MDGILTDELEDVLREVEARMAAATGRDIGAATGGAGKASRGGKRPAGAAAGGAASPDATGVDAVLTRAGMTSLTEEQTAAVSRRRRMIVSRLRREARFEEAVASKDKKDLRSPVVVVMGHVDTGKTSLLDKIRETNVQGHEAGGITQQIGATFFPIDRLREQTEKINREKVFKYKVPGILVVDTPGHESFHNLRSRGQNLCDIAVLVVDIMKKEGGLERQTLESLDMLRRRGTPFVVALNKCDRVHEWKSKRFNPIRDSLKEQSEITISDFDDRVRRTVAAF